MTTVIDIIKFNKRLLNGEPLTLLDVRRKADVDANPRCIAGAVYRDPEKVDIWGKELSADSPTVVYCVKGGSVSQSVTERLRRSGIEAVFLEGGLKAWTEAGHPVVEVHSVDFGY